MTQLIFNTFTGGIEPGLESPFRKPESGNSYYYRHTNLLRWDYFTGSERKDQDPTYLTQPFKNNQSSIRQSARRPLLPKDRCVWKKVLHTAHTKNNLILYYQHRWEGRQKSVTIPTPSFWPYRMTLGKKWNNFSMLRSPTKITNEVESGVDIE